MTTLEASPLPLELPAPTAGRSRMFLNWDVRTLTLAVLVPGVTFLSALFALLAWSVLPGLSFSGRASIPYVAFVFLFILVMGWSPRTFPLAGAMFFAYMCLGQAAHDTYFPFGDINGAFTWEELLAIPLMLTGFFGPAAPQRGRPLPFDIRLGFILVLMSAILSTVLALQPSVAAWTLFARFVMPIGVIFALYRRLRDIRDLDVVMFGLVLGMCMIMLFGAERTTEGGGTAITDPLGQSVNQRYAIITVSAAIPGLYVMGMALWNSRARAEAGLPLRAMGWLVLAGLMPVLFWIGAHRAPLVGACLITLIWLPGSFRPLLTKPFAIAVLAVGVLVVVFLARYVIDSSMYDTVLMQERLTGLWEGGLKHTNRQEIWELSWQGWLASPLWGAGLNHCVVIQNFYASTHSSALGLLLDVGLFGVAAFLVLFIAVVRVPRRRIARQLSVAERQSANGQFWTWLVMHLVLLADIPFTSAQPKMNIYAYLAYFYPLTAMILVTRYPAARTTQPARSHPVLPLPGDVTIAPMPVPAH